MCSILCRHQHPVCLTPHNDSEMVKADEKQMIVQRFLGKQTATAFWALHLICTAGILWACQPQDYINKCEQRIQLITTHCEALWQLCFFFCFFACSSCWTGNLLVSVIQLLEQTEMPPSSFLCWQRLRHWGGLADATSLRDVTMEQRKTATFTLELAL